MKATGEEATVMREWNQHWWNVVQVAVVSKTKSVVKVERGIATVTHITIRQWARQM